MTNFMSSTPKFAIALDSDETSSTSSKLIHGGLRYLESFDFKLVRQALKEREILKKIAPHLVKEIPFLFPIYRYSGKRKITIKAGMVLYDFFSLDGSLPSHQMLNKTEVLERVPALKEETLNGAALFYDCQLINPERFCLENILDACQIGATALNYVELKELKKEKNRINSLVLKDIISGKEFNIKGKYIVNAAGPWVDEVCMKAFENSNKIKGAKGVHLFVKKFTEHPIISNTSDKRTFFVIPWKNMTMIGTTDTDYKGDLGSTYATKEDISYLLKETNNIFENFKLDYNDILYTIAGVRPLISKKGNESKISRRHTIYDHAKEGLENFVSIGGGKITTYRKIAEEVVDLICKKMNIKENSKTADMILPNALNNEERESLIQSAKKEYRINEKINEKLVENLIDNYGNKYHIVLEYDKNHPAFRNMCMSKRRICLCNSDILAQVVYAVKYEKAKKLNDVLFRRLDIGNKNCFAEDSFDTISRLMQTLLGWDDERTRKEEEDYSKFLELRNTKHRKKIYDNPQE